jgi:hypothetical protein
MEARDRRLSLALFAAAGVAWVVVGLVVLTLDPRASALNGYVGAVAIGIAAGVTSAPLFWLVGFARQHRIAYRGDWTRALRRGAWIVVLVSVFVVLRLQGILQLPVALFLVAMAWIAESAIASQR